MAKTLFNASWDERGFLNVEIKNDRPGSLYLYLARYTAPVVYYQGVPLQIEMDHKHVYVTCLYGDQTVWMYDIHFTVRKQSETRVLAPFEPDAKFTPQPICLREGNDVQFIMTFRIRLVEKIPPFHRELPVVVCNNGDKRLSVGYEMIDIKQNLLARRSQYFAEQFRQQPDLPFYTVEQPSEIVKQFVKLACLHCDFTFDVRTIEELMFACQNFKAYECLLECVDFLFRTERMARIDKVILLEKFPQFGAYMQLMANQVNAELHQKELRRLWKTDTRSVSDTVKQITESYFSNVRHLSYKIFFNKENPYEVGKRFERTETLTTLEEGREKEWKVTVVVHTEGGKILLSIYSDNTVPWFVAASITFSTRTSEGIHYTTWAERIIVTSETGCKRFKQVNQSRIFPGSIVEIIVRITGALQTKISENFTDFTENNTFWNFKLIVAESESEVKEFFVHRELLEHCSAYFKSVFNLSWREAANNYYRIEDSIQRVNTFLAIAYNPRIVITNDNFLEFLDASLFYGTEGMIARLEEFYRGCLIVPEVKEAADRSFSNVFPAVDRKYNVYIRRTPLTEAQVSRWHREARIGQFGLQVSNYWLRKVLNPEPSN